MKVGRTFLIRLVSVLLLVAAGGLYLGRDLFGGSEPVRRVILISIDTCRSDVLGCYNPAQQTTPNIDAFAETATLFRNAISPVPITLPAHSSMLTGLRPPTHGVRNQPGYRLPSHTWTAAEVLQREGWATGAIVSSSVLHHSTGLEQGFDTYNDEFVNARRGGWGMERDGGEATEAAIQWLGAHQNDDEFFLFLHYYDLHLPYDSPSEFAERFGPDISGQYAAEMAYVDACIGRVFDELKRLGLYEDSLIIITGDHGEMLGEHGEFGHQFFIYQPAVHVPLLMRLPGQKKAREVADVVGLVDILPTICTAAQTNGRPVMEGRDLMGYLTGKNPPAGGSERSLYCESTVPASYGANPLFGLVGPRWKYIETTRPELYDLPDDPEELTNLVADHPGPAGDLARRVQAIVLGGQADGTARATVWDGQEERLTGLGYTGGSPGETPRMDRTLPDPKDLISLHDRYQGAVLMHVQGQRDEALAICRELIAEKSDFLMARTMLARELAKDGNYAESLEHLDAILEAAPDSPGELAYRAGVHESAGSDALALADYSRALALDATMGTVHLKRAKLLARTGDPGGAIADLIEALKTLPADSPDRSEAQTLLQTLGEPDGAATGEDQ